MILSLSVRFYLNEKKEKESKKPIYLRITVNRKKAEIATRYLVEAKDWDKAKQRSKKDPEVNEYLVKLENEVFEIAKRLDREDRPITAFVLKNILLKKDRLDAFLILGCLVLTLVSRSDRNFFKEQIRSYVYVCGRSS